MFTARQHKSAILEANRRVRRPRKDVSPVSIEYCVPAGYERVAADIAEAVRDECRLSTELVPSRGGVFEVHVNGRLVFSKRASWRLPDPDEVLFHIQHPKP